MSRSRIAGSDRISVNAVDCLPGDWQTRLQNLRDIWPRGPQAPQLSTGGTGRMYFARWSNFSQTKNVEFIAPSGSEDHIMFFPIRAWDITCNIGRKTALDGHLYPGDIFYRCPDTSRSRSIYRERFDVFRITLPDDLIREGLEGIGGRDVRPKAELFGTQTFNDRILHQLAMSLFASSTSDIALDSIYIDSIGLAISAHLAAKYYGKESLFPAKRAKPLANWRLKRVVDYIDANFVREISLLELGAVAGLSRMYFAAQFRASTGRSPHAFITERRIFRARELLLETNLPLALVAEVAGFRSYTHFIRTFRSQVGMSPGRWRNLRFP